MKSKEPKFNIEFPGEPEYRTEVVNGLMKSYTYKPKGNKNDDNGSYFIEYMESDKNDTISDSIISRHIQSLLKATKGQLLSHKEIRLKNKTGKEAEIEFKYWVRDIYNPY